MAELVGKVPGQVPKNGLKCGKMQEITPDIILVDKPAGITSFDVIRTLRRRFGRIKMGHAGTLDPFATGLMIIATGESTKKLSEFLKLPKSYEAEILFGIQTDTGDITGKIIKEKVITEINRNELENALQKITGKNEFRVPRFSAIKINGKRLYAYAREGKEIETPTKQMEVFQADLQNIKNEGAQITAHVRFDVASGTYIRTLAEEIGTILGIPATLRQLRRTKIGNFRIQDAEKL